MHVLRLSIIVLLIPAGCGHSASGPSTEPSKESSSDQRMRNELEKVREASLRNHPFLGNGRLLDYQFELDELEQKTGVVPDAFLAACSLDLHFQIGEEQLKTGQTEAAIQSLSSALDLALNSTESVKPETVENIRFRLAVACLRKAEDENCLHCDNEAGCLLPIRGNGVHTNRSGSAQAAEHLSAILDANAEHLSARWLLNVVHMTLGQYPHAIPEKLRVPESVFESDAVFPRWKNVSHEWGLDLISLAGGAIVDDFNNDGWLDVVVSSWEPTGTLKYYRGMGHQRFSEATEGSGLEGIMGGLNLIQADYDNDGDVDVLVLRGAWLESDGRHPNSLLQNDGTGRFRDVTFEAGLGDEFFPTQTAAWADFDNDGDLDLFVGNEAYPSQLFENDGTGKFTDIAGVAGVAESGGVKGCVWGDFNNDRLPDLYVSNLTGPNRLFRNNGNGKFEDVAEDLGVNEPLRSFPCWFWDYNNDGVLDLYVAAYWSKLKYFAADYIGLEHEAETDRLYVGDGEGGFRDASREAGIDSVTLPMGSNFGDMNNDGFPDCYLGTGFPAYEALLPNKLYLNDRGRKFVDVTTAGGFGHLQKGHGVAFADMDNDGDQDIFIETGGAFAGDAFANLLFENPGDDNHWLKLRLRGTTSNRLGVGARIRAVISESETQRSVFHWANSGGSFGARPLMRQEIGLGQARVIDRLEVYWPASDTTQSFTDVPVDTYCEVIEGEPEIRQLPLP